MDSGRPTSAARAPRTFKFGPDECLVAAITDPKGGAAKVGAIIWGMGVGDVLIARALARLGIVVVQVRQKERAFQRLDTAGVAYCKAAIELLAEQRGIDSFILLGNCGRASICFRTALDDPRVTGLILSNPHVSQVFTVKETYKRKLLSLNSWKRVLTGRAGLRYHLNSARLLKMLLLGRLTRMDEKTLAEKTNDSGDLAFPDRIDDRLRGLAARGARIFMVFSETDAGLDYFRKLYGKQFERLQGVPRVSVEVLRTSEHVISLDDSAAKTFADAISHWAGSAGFQTGAAHAPAHPALAIAATLPSGMYFASELLRATSVLI